MDTTGRRTPLTPTRIRTAPEKLVLSKNQSLTKRIEIDSSKLEGRALGRYRLFVDFKTATNRTPSNAVPLDWRLDTAELQQLIRMASGGARDGRRNRPLKLMRLHLGEIDQALDQVPESELSENGRKLLGELQLAAGLKPIAPKPGQVTVKLRITSDGSIQFADTALDQVFRDNKPTTEQIAAMVNVRRHLGWIITLELRPDKATTPEQLAAAYESLKPLISAEIKFIVLPN